MEEVYSSDEPISCKNEDLFNRASFASRIAQTLAARADSSSIVIGLYGPLGNGKTSTLKMIEEDLKEYSHIVTIFFNPWLFKSEEALLRGFFSSLATSFKRSLTGTKEKIGNLLENYGDLVSLGSLTFAGGMIGINPAAGVKSLGKAISTVSLEDLKNNIEKMLEEEKKRIVIFIDDIDRLDRDETHAIFKLIKLSGGFKYTSYIVSFDYDVVSTALAERYGDGGQRAGGVFLEKIIQVPLFLPPVSESSLQRILFQGINEALLQSQIYLTQQEVNELYMSIIYGFGRKISTPRLVKLYQNALTFVLPIMKGEVNPVDLILIEGIRIIYPHLYKEIQKKYKLFLDAPNSKDSAKRRSDINLLLEEYIQDSTHEDRENFLKFILMYLFPCMLMNIGKSENERTKFQRISSPKYFNRYFQYGIPHDQISDVLVINLIDNISTMEQDEVNKKLREFYEEGKLSNFIDKIKYI